MNNFMTKHGLTFSSTSQGSDKGEADDTAKGLWVQGSTQNLVYVEKSIQGKRKVSRFIRQILIDLADRLLGRKVYFRVCERVARLSSISRATIDYLEYHRSVCGGFTG